MHLILGSLTTGHAGARISVPGLIRRISSVPVRVLSFAWLLVLTPSLVQAHPHGWVDYTVRVLFDGSGRVTALEQRWKFDPLYSLTLSEVLNEGKSKESKQQQLDSLGSDIANNIAKLDYLSHIYREDKPLKFGKLKDYTLLFTDQRLEFAFVLPLETPQSLADDTLTWQVYDPTYFIEFLYDNKAAEPIVLVNAPEGCTASVEHYKPAPEEVARAAAIDVTGEAPEGYGKMFADTGTLQCPDH